ncbi:MAG TPA: ATP-binding protein [Cyclobacteriaceae bacterium]|nr:ATP-binding protein [Cyclobacteriaceae bacterium]
MRSGRFNVTVTAFAISIAIISALFIKAAGAEGYTFTSLGLIVLWISGIIFLIHYVSVTNRNLLLFLQSFRFHDSTIEFNRIKKFPFQLIYDEFNRIIQEFKLLKQEKELEHQYYEHVVKHANTGLIAWDELERITLINDTAKSTLKIPFVATLGGLAGTSKGMPDELRKLDPGIKKLLRINIGNEIIPLSVNLSRFKLENRSINLVALNDLRNELEENESDAWQKLMRILNHEIVNSLSPIKLVSSALSSKVESMNSRDPETRDISGEIREGLKAIHNRSAGLLRFIEDYKAITDVPKPELRNISVHELVLSVVSLVKGTIVPDKIELRVDGNAEDLLILADKDLIEQVLINLIKNSVYALRETTSPVISIRGFQGNKGKGIVLQDNGCGIPFNIRDFIFMPFFTTKKDGTGIGLSWSRQIMRMHKGRISIDSQEGSGTRILLLFN